MSDMQKNAPEFSRRTVVRPARSAQLPTNVAAGATIAAIALVVALVGPALVPNAWALFFALAVAMAVTAAAVALRDNGVPGRHRRLDADAHGPMGRHRG